MKVTPCHYADCDSLRETQMKFEIHLDNINQKTKGSIAATTSRIWRRISNLSSTSMRIRSNDANHNVIEDFGHVRLKKVNTPFTMLFLLIADCFLFTFDYQDFIGAT